jgi:outer membrane biosynthesis protein TonB
MSFKDGEMHVVSLFATIVVSVGLVVPAWWYGSEASADDKPAEPIQMEAIEASIAIAKAPQKQPQKEFRPPNPEVKPEGVSHEDKPPDKPKPKEEKPKPADNTKLKPPPDRTHVLDDEKPVGEQKAPAGPPSDNQRGFADVTKGDPFFQHLARDWAENFSYPGILDAEKVANACIYFSPDGKIAGWKLLPKSGDDTLDDAAERGLKAIEKLRDATPEAPPTHVLRQATTTWTCFKAGGLKREE